jgi:F-type H+-transporting ATPase subunit b
MTWNFFSFFLSNEEGFLTLEINTNIFETNIINLAILFSILVYGYKSSFGPSLKIKQKEIIQTIENAQIDVVRALKYYLIAERGFKRSLFSLNAWKTAYDAEKTSFVENKYAVVKKGFTESFSTTESLIKNFENKAFISLQRYLLVITTSRILRKFLVLSPVEKSKLIQSTISQLGGVKK